jgi:hypothetical protein
MKNYKTRIPELSEAKITFNDFGIRCIKKNKFECELGRGLVKLNVSVYCGLSQVTWEEKVTCFVVRI